MHAFVVSIASVALAAWLLAPSLKGFAFFEFCPFSFAADSPRQKEVLVLFSFSDQPLGNTLESFKAAVRAHAQGPVNFQVEYLESQRFEDPAYEQRLSEAFGYIYASKKLDVVLVQSFPPLRFALAHRDEMFPGVPIVFNFVDARRIQDQQLPRDVTGDTVTIDVRGSLELAFRLHPDTKNVVVVTGTTASERYWLKVFHEAFLKFQNKSELIDLVGFPTDQIMTQVSRLPPHTVDFIQMTPRSSAQPVFGLFEAMTLISQRVPMYCIYSSYCVDDGGIRGSYADPREQTVKAADLVVRLLSGESAEKIPMVHDSGARAVVDWRQLRRWNIPESVLHAGSIILYRELTPWERYRKYFLGGVAVLVLQALLIIGLLKQRANRRAVERSLVAGNRELKKSEASLRESEQRFRRVADTAPVLIWMSGTDKLFTFLNQGWLKFTGRSMEDEIGEGWVSRMHPDDLQRCLAIYSTSFDARAEFEMEYRLSRFDGEYRWLADHGVPRFESDGAFCGYIGICVDITERKLSEASLQSLSGRLIRAQEEERARIARELHDDFSQRMALQGIGLGQLWKRLPESEVEERERVWKMLKSSQDMTDDMHSLSHQLHSSKLEHVGLVAALEGLRREIGEKYRIDIQFTNCEVTAKLPKDVALCLFRVAQEALGNVVKHSQAKRANIELGANENGISLRIKDEGKGFDPHDSNLDAGIGLVGMTERLRLVAGRLSIRSELMRGTEIVAEVPLSAFTNEKHASTHVAGGGKS